MEIVYPYVQIRDFLTSYYDDNDLDSLFFEIYGDSIDILGKGLPRPKLAQEIVIYCKNRGDLPKLLDAMKRSREELYSQNFPQILNPLGSLGLSLKPAETELQQAEVEGINLPRVQEAGGYMIDEPPADWIVEEITLRELIAKRLGTDLDENAFTNQFGDPERFNQRDILWVSSRSQLKIEYDPGASLINGRPTLALVPEAIPVALLTIIPLERNSTPPAFIRQSFEHTFVAQLAVYLQIANLKSSFASTTKNTNRLRLTAEFDQRIENVIVDGRPNQSLTTNQTLIGIQGFARDFLLTLSYVSQATSNKAEIENQMALLQSLVDSFKLIKPADVDQQERQSLTVGDQRYQKYIELYARQILENQSGLLMEQWSELDWEKAESRERVIQDIKRFKKAIEVFTGDDKHLDELKDLLNELTQMSLSEMKAFMTSKDQPQP